MLYGKQQVAPLTSVKRNVILEWSVCRREMTVSSLLLLKGHEIQSFNFEKILCSLLWGYSSHSNCQSSTDIYSNVVLSHRRGLAHPRRGHWGHPVLETFLLLLSSKCQKEFPCIRTTMRMRRMCASFALATAMDCSQEKIISDWHTFWGWGLYFKNYNLRPNQLSQTCISAECKIVYFHPLPPWHNLWSGQHHFLDI